RFKSFPVESDDGGGERVSLTDPGQGSRRGRKRLDHLLSKGYLESSSERSDVKCQHSLVRSNGANPRIENIDGDIDGWLPAIPLSKNGHQARTRKAPGFFCTISTLPASRFSKPAN